MSPVPLHQARAALVACAAAILMQACGGDESNGPSNREPAKTPAGTPTGPLVTQTIGPAGGTVTSADGELTVIIPAGALAGDVAIGVQPVTAQSPGAVGAAYRLTPDGTTFTQPVTLAFSYDDDDLEGTVPQLLWIATQEADGSWLLLRGVVLDEVARTLTATTTHFTDFTRLEGLQIRPPSARIKAGQSQNLEVKKCTTIVDVSTGNQSAYAIDCEDAPTAPPPESSVEDDLPSLPSFSVDASSWAVNGTRGGSSQFGFVAGQGSKAEYAAPAQAPTTQNPVAVSVRVRTTHDQQTYQLVAHIEIERTCGPAASVRWSRDDVCTLDWIGNSSSQFIHLFRVEAQVRWKYDAEASAIAGANKAAYYAEGMVKVFPLDACTMLEPDHLTWTRGSSPGTGGALLIDYNPETPTYLGSGGATWFADATDTCDEDGESQRVPIPAAWFYGQGTLSGADFSEVSGTSEQAGQSFTYVFTRMGGSAGGSRAAGARQDGAGR